MALKSAFCCASLKTGTLVLGWLTLITILVHAVIVSIVLGVTSGSKSGETGERNVTIWDGLNEFDSEIMPLSTYLSLHYILFVVQAAAVICLLYGTMKGRSNLLLPYLVVFSAIASLGILIVIYRFVTGTHWINLVPRMLETSFGIYILCIVRGHYDELRFQDRPVKMRV